MPFNDAYLDAMAVSGQPITHIGLVKSDQTPIAAARQAVSWAAPVNGGDQRITADKTFALAAGESVAGWQGFSAITAGTAYGIIPLPTETYPNGGEYVLEAANTGSNLAATGS